MLPAADQVAAHRWRKLASEIGRKACHGAAHNVRTPEIAWLASGWEDFKAVCDALDRPPPSFSDRSGTTFMPALGRVLDFGAGAGRLVPYLADSADEVVAFDASPALLGECPRRPNIHTLAASDPSMLEGVGPFDTIISVHTLYSMTPDGVAEVLYWFGQVLADGGRAAVDIPWRTLPGPYHEDPDPEGLPGGWWVHTMRSVGEACEKAGLRVLRAPQAVQALQWQALAQPSLWSMEKA